MDALRDSMDLIVVNLDRFLRTCSAPARARRPSPAATVADDSALSPRDIDTSIGLMRVNHAGEVSAQALYHGQALFARARATRLHLEHAAREESDHLAWCAERLVQLGGRPSYLVPLWYAGSFAVGAAAALAGDATSLGFVRETERQVESHLDDHMRRLPADDRRSRAILTQMAIDEDAHGRAATRAGAIELPPLLSRLMGVGGAVLRRVARVL